MGDRHENSRRHANVGRPWLRLRRPPELVGWGLPAPIGHNNGPPLDEPQPDAYLRYKWRRAHREAWALPSMSIVRFRVARAEAAGVDYRTYMLELLDSGRHLQAGDVATRRESEIDDGGPCES